MKLPKGLFLYVCAFLLVMAGFYGQGSVARAESGISMSASAGIAGEYKEFSLIPLHVTITNQGADIEGQLVFSVTDDSAEMATYFQPVSIASGATKSITMQVPGKRMLSNQSVRLMQGEKELAKADVKGQWYGPKALFIGVLAADANTANFLQTLPKETFSEPIRLLPLEEKDLSAASLQLLDVLIINNYATDHWPQEQINQIKQWVSRGGTLVVGGGPHVNKAAHSFTELLPVDVRGTAALASLTAFSRYHEEQAVGPAQMITVSKATVKGGQVLYQEGEIPLLVLNGYDRGKVLYVAYDLAEEPLAGWQGNGRLWSDVLLKAKLLANSSFADDQPYYLLNRAAAAFPSLQPPNFTVLALFFFGYALLVGPVIFLLFRKKRRSYIWGVVPLISVVTCAAIYLYGNYHHGNQVKIATASHLRLSGEGPAELLSASSLFVPGSGHYQLKLKGVDLLLPGDWGYQTQQAERTWINLAKDVSSIEYKNVEHWSIRSNISRQYLPDSGKLDVQLMVRDDKLVGTVVNNSKYPLQDVKVVAGNQVEDIGNLASGATVDVELDYSVDQLQGPPFSIEQLLPVEVQQSPNPWLTREYTMVQIFDRGRARGLNTAPIRVFGWTEEPIVQLEAAGREIERTDITLVTAEAKMKPNEQGYVIYPAGTFPPVKVASTVPVNEDSEGLYMGAGEVTFDFHLSDETGRLQPTALHLYTWSHSRTAFEKHVFNWVTQTYEPYEEVMTDNSLSGEKLTPYLSEENTFRIKFAHSQEYEEHLGYPTITVEGWVK